MHIYILIYYLSFKKMAVKKKSAQRIKKEAYWHRLIDVAGKYKNALFVDSDNVSSKQISNLRKRLREIDAYMIMGKNVSIGTLYWDHQIH